MTTIHTTPTGAKVHLSAQHAALFYPDDVAQQARFMALGASGHDDTVQREVTASIERQRLHMRNVGVLLREQAI